MQTNIPTPVARDEPSLDRIYHALTVLPVVVGFLFTGLVGGIIGTLVNRWLAGREMRHRVKVATMLGVATLATAGSLVGSIALAPIPKFDTGSCVNGIHDGSNVLARGTRPADCKNPHDGEVVGTVDYAVQAAFPGDDALLALAQEPCLAAFASYVGIDYTSSSLEMGVVTPDDISWLKGDRQGVCVVSLPGGGGKLTGSVKGSAH